MMSMEMNMIKFLLKVCVLLLDVLLNIFPWHILLLNFKVFSSNVLLNIFPWHILFLNLKIFLSDVLFKDLSMTHLAVQGRSVM